MSKFLIIDSNQKFAAKLKQKLENLGQMPEPGSIPQNRDLTTSYLFNIAQSLKNNEEKIVLINLESKIGDGKLQDQILAELLFWLRCKHKFKNSVVFYGFQSINKILAKNPKNYILHSSGCYYFQLPFNEEQLKKISTFKPIKQIDEIRPFLKPNIDLEQTRHSYANYAGMNLILNVTKQVHNKSENQILDNAGKLFDKFYNFRNSLDYHILSTYFNLEKNIVLDENEKTLLKIDDSVSSKKILLIDDLAENGWENILKQSVYGDVSNNNLKSISIKDDLINEVASKIDSHKPHLILLDLRLKNEEGKQKTTELDGFKLLKHIKSHKKYKGVPVIMFTASSKAETTKQLLDAGAEAVWTKPGLDEGLNPDEIKERYKYLIELIKDVFEPDYTPLKQLNDTSDSGFDSKNVDFESLRNLLFRKLDFIRYRLQLYDNPIELTEPYKSADAIYLDANSLITGDEKIDFSEIISSVLTIAVLTSQSNCDFVTGMQNMIFPKVVIMNTVYDELLKLAKTKNVKWDSDYNVWRIVCKRAAISQLVVKELFDNKCIRTEFNQNVRSVLQNPKENPYADGYILDEIASLVVTHKLSKTVSYQNSTKVVFVSGDNGLIKKLECFNSNSTKNLIIKNRQGFIEDILKIKF